MMALRLMTKSFLLLMSVLLFSKDVLAKSLPVKQYSIDEGLSQSAVNDILQGPKGYYWFATQDGLNRYDGYHFKIYNRTTHPELKSKFITKIEKLDEEHLVIGTQAGVYQLHIESEQINSLSSSYGFISDLYVSDSGLVIVENEQLLSISNQAYKKLSTKEPASNPSIFSYQSQLYFITSSGDIAPVSEKEVLPPAFIKFNEMKMVRARSVFSNNENAWIASTDGVWLVSKNQLIHLVENIDASSVAVNQKNDLWIVGATGVFVVSVNRKGVSSLNRIVTDSMEHGTLKGKAFLSLYIDGMNQVWFGTRSHGVAMYSPSDNWFENHSVYSDTFPLPASDVLAIYHGLSSTWVGTSSGVAEFKGGEAHVFNMQNQPNFKSDKVAKIIEDDLGTTWLGFVDGPVMFMEKGTKEFVQLETLGSNFHVTDFLCWQQNIYVVTRNSGLFVIDIKSKKLIRAFSKSAGTLSTNRLQSIYRDQLGEIWLGTFGQGVQVWDKNTEQFIELSEHENIEFPSLKNAIISDIYRNGDMLWVATGSGLLSYNLTTNQKKWIKQAEGLPNDTVYTVIEDSKGLFWLPTNKGLVLYSPNTGSIEVFTKKDGLINNEYNANAFDVDPNGTIWMGGGEGFSVIKPEEKQTYQATPQPTLTDIKLFNRSMHQSELKSIKDVDAEIETLHFSPEMNMFTLYFSTFQPNLSNVLRYRYRLDGFNKDWVMTEPGQNYATYTNLGFGSYQLNVEATLDGVNWSEPRIIAIKAHAPIWWSIPAKIFYLSVILGIIFIIWVQARSKRKLELESFRKIREKAQRLRLSMQTAGNILWEIDVYKQKIAVMDYRLKPLERKHYEFNESGILQFIAKEDSLPFLSLLTHQIKTDDFTQPHTFKFLSEEGPIWMEGYAIVSERGSKGNIKKIVGIGQNIDELLRVQLELKKLNEELEQRVADRTQKLNVANREIKRTLDNLKHTQEELLENKKLASLGSMVAGIAHEVNTPLGIGVTSVTFLKSSLKDLVDKFEHKTLSANDFTKYHKSSTESLELLETNLNKASELINSFKQVSVDQSSEEKRSFSVRKLVDDVLFTLSPKFNRQNVTVDVEIDSELTISSYPGALSQVLINLAMNSLTHGFRNKTEGHIKVLCTKVKADQDEVLLIFTDDGDGIAETNLAKVFEPFYTSNRSGGNTGLGMHISYNLVVQKLEGAIAINSLLGQGTEFYIRLPSKI